jgi:hypothetical protein
VLITQHPVSANVGTNFADKRMSLGVRWRTQVTEFFPFGIDVALTSWPLLVVKLVQAILNSK